MHFILKKRSMNQSSLKLNYAIIMESYRICPFHRTAEERQTSIFRPENTAAHSKTGQAKGREVRGKTDEKEEDNRCVEKV
jgi:hypothetical protein